MSDTVYCVLDYETFSEAPLKKVGAFEYSVHPSTDIICAAWRIGTRGTLPTAQTMRWAPGAPNSAILTLLNAIADSRITLVAHNAYFEQVITRHVLARLCHTQTYLAALPPERWVCTAALAAALALPRSLEGAGKALALPVQKSMDGHRLMLKWSKPRKPTKHDARTRHDDPAELARVMDYCCTDVDAEVALFLTVPMLTPAERRVWLLDQKINWRGFAVDRPLTETVLGMLDVETKRLTHHARRLGAGEFDSTKQVAKVKGWLERRGVFLPNLQKKTVETAIKEGLAEGDALELLHVRQSLAKTSTAKYQAFELGSRHDGRIRDILVYHTASTGRWGGARVQPQNLPKPTIGDTLQAARILAADDLEMVRLIYGDPMNVFSSCLRNLIVAPPGKVLDVADYNAIEVRVLFWVAGHETGLQAFRDGRDLYRELGSVIYHRPQETIDDKQRFIAKQAVIGAGYGLGHVKFTDYCRGMGADITEELGKAAIDAYRTVHRPVVVLWENLGRAAVAAVQNPGKIYSVNGTRWFRRGRFLFCELPSGRRLAYCDPSVKKVKTAWGEVKPTLHYYGVDATTKKWAEQRNWGGGLVENVVQAVARDLMASAMLRIEAAGWEIVLSVHDELVAERPVMGDGTHEEFCRLMSTVPKWAPGLPVRVEGFSGKRYKK